MSNDLKQEMQTFEAHKAELIGTANGKFVLIKGDKVLGIFESQTDAINEGYRQLGLVPFLVKQIHEFDTPVHFFSRQIAL